MNSNKRIPTPFQVPENYFEKFEASLQKRLQKMHLPEKKSLPFILPEQYFEKLPQRIVQKIQRKSTHKIWYAIPQWQWVFRVSSVVFLVAITILWFLPKQNNDLLLQLKTHFSKSELEHYLVNDYKNFLEEELLQQAQIFNIDIHDNTDTLQTEIIEKNLLYEHLEEILQQELPNIDNL